MRKRLLLTFDYELFLGEKSGSVDRCLIEPTNRMMAIFDKYRIAHAIFFVDTTHLIRLEELADTHPAAQHDLTKIKQQLQKLVRNRHYVFPHLHPHWLDAEYDAESNEFSLTDLKHYRFHNVPKADRERLFTRSVELLTEWLSSEQHDYKPDGFRAGGWCIQPFEDFKPLFEQHGFTHEFSVLPGFTSFTNAQYHDFDTVPAKDIYRFSTKVTKEDSEGPFTQYTISSVEVPSSKQLWNRLLLKYHWKRGIRSLGDGRGVIPQAVEGKEVDTAVETAVKRERVAIELLNSVTLPIYTKFLKAHDYMHFISHPKMLTTHNLSVMDRFLAQASSNYDLETDFRKMTPEA